MNPYRELVRGVGVIELYSRKGDPMGTGEADLFCPHQTAVRVYDDEVVADVVIADAVLAQHGLPEGWQLFIRPEYLATIGELDGHTGSLKGKYGTAVAVRRRVTTLATLAYETLFSLRLRVSSPLV